MQVIGNLGADLTQRTNRTTGKSFYVTRLAETLGKGEQKTTTWFDVILNISEEKADMLRKGMFVKVVGRVYADVYEGKAQLKLSSSFIEPYEARSRSNGQDNGSAPAGEPDYDKYANDLDHA